MSMIWMMSMKSFKPKNSASELDAEFQHLYERTLNTPSTSSPVVVPLLSMTPPSPWRADGLFIGQKLRRTIYSEYNEVEMISAVVIGWLNCEESDFVDSKNRKAALYKIVFTEGSLIGEMEDLEEREMIESLMSFEYEKESNCSEIERVSEQKTRTKKNAPKKCASKFIGIKYSHGYWFAQITINKLFLTIGKFSSEEGAARRYDVFARPLERNTNFPSSLGVVKGSREKSVCKKKKLCCISSTDSTDSLMAMFNHDHSKKSKRLSPRRLKSDEEISNFRKTATDQPSIETVMNSKVRRLESMESSAISRKNEPPEDLQTKKDTEEEEEEEEEEAMNEEEREMEKDDVKEYAHLESLLAKPVVVSCITTTITAPEPPPPNEKDKVTEKKIRRISLNQRRRKKNVETSKKIAQTSSRRLSTDSLQIKDNRNQQSFSPAMESLASPMLTRKKLIDSESSSDESDSPKRRVVLKSKRKGEAPYNQRRPNSHRTSGPKSVNQNIPTVNTLSKKRSLEESNVSREVRNSRPQLGPGKTIKSTHPPPVSDIENLSNVLGHDEGWEPDSCDELSLEEVVKDEGAGLTHVEEPRRRLLVARYANGEIAHPEQGHHEIQKELKEPYGARPPEQAASQRNEPTSMTNTESRPWLPDNFEDVVTFLPNGSIRVKAPSEMLSPTPPSIQSQAPFNGQVVAQDPVSYRQWKRSREHIAQARIFSSATTPVTRSPYIPFRPESQTNLTNPNTSTHGDDKEEEEDIFACFEDEMYAGMFD